MIVEGSQREHISAVVGLRMDATFVIGDPPAAGCRVESVGSEQMMVALSDAHRLARIDRSLEWGDLTDEHFIVSKTEPGPDIENLIVKHLAVLGRHPAVEPRPVGRDALIALVGLEFGISLVGESIAAITYLV